MIHNIKNPTDLSGLYFIYRGSTNLERKGIYGIAHLMEHLQCKNFDDLQNVLQENGISWNAYTSHDYVVFYFTGLEKYLAPFRSNLIERMSSFTVTEEEVEKEKKIVLEEYLDSFTDQSQAHYLNFNRKYLGTYSPIGLKEDIENITYQDCLDFFNAQYANPDEIVNISKTFVLKDPNIKFTNRRNNFVNFTPNNNAILEETVEYVDKTSIIWHKEVSSSDQPMINMICKMLGGGLNSPLYQEVREKRGLVYYLHCYSYNVGLTSHINISTTISDDNINTLNETIKEVLNNRKKYLTLERFETVKKSLIIAKEKSEINKFGDISDILDPEIKKFYDKLDSLTMNEINNIYDKYFDPEGFLINTDKELKCVTV